MRLIYLKYLLRAMKRLYGSSYGFSLVELSVVLAIIGVTLGGALTIATKKTESDKEEETQAHLDLIEHALERYLTEQQRLPCPASGSAVMDDTSGNTYGLAGEASTGGCTDSNFDDGGFIFSGTVPTKTLGLMDEVGIDGWGRRFTYVVDYHFANSNNTNLLCNGEDSTVCFQHTESGSIQINDAAGAARTTEAVYALISHGKNGYGAYGYYGNATRLSFPATPDADEVENSGTDSPYDAIFVQKTSDEHFDDVVRYKPKWQLVNDANGITDTNICTPAKTAIDTPDIAGGDSENGCSNAVNVDLCQEMAEKVYRLCL